VAQEIIEAEIVESSEKSLEKKESFGRGGARLCKDFTKTGEPCKGPALVDSEYCHHHAFKHNKPGRPASSFTSYKKRPIQELLEAARHDPNLMGMENEIVTVAALIEHKIGQAVTEEMTDEIMGQILLLTSKSVDMKLKHRQAQKLEQETYNLKQVEFLLDYLAATGRRFITDPRARKEFEKEIMAIPAEKLDELA
jgi:hypothetical protein